MKITHDKCLDPTGLFWETRPKRSQSSGAARPRRDRCIICGPCWPTYITALLYGNAIIFLKVIKNARQPGSKALVTWGSSSFTFKDDPGLERPLSLAFIWREAAAVLT